MNNMSDTGDYDRRTSGSSPEFLIPGTVLGNNCSTEQKGLLQMPRTLDAALSLSPINMALIEGSPGYPDTLIRLRSDGSARGLQVQDGKDFQRAELTPTAFEAFKIGVNASKLNCRPLD